LEFFKKTYQSQEKLVLSKVWNPIDFETPIQGKICYWLMSDGDTMWDYLGQTIF